MDSLPKADITRSNLGENTSQPASNNLTTNINQAPDKGTSLPALLS